MDCWKTSRNGYAMDVDEPLGPRAVMHTTIGDILVRRPVMSDDTHYHTAEWIFQSPLDNETTPVWRDGTWCIPKNQVLAIDFDSDEIFAGEEWRG